MKAGYLIPNYYGMQYFPGLYFPIYGAVPVYFQEQLNFSTPLIKSLSFNTGLVKTKNFKTTLTKSLSFKTDL